VNNNKERRKYKRVSVHIPVKYRALNSSPDDPNISTVTKNISERGIRFRASEFISIATRLVMEMDVPLLNKPIKAISKIAWIQKTPAGNDYEVGGYFLEMAKKDKEIISEYVGNVDYKDDPEQDKPKKDNSSK